MSLRQAINAKCRECIYDPKAGLGGWREQVTACTCLRCPLYAVRPRTKADTPKDAASEEAREPPTFTGNPGIAQRTHMETHGCT